MCDRDRKEIDELFGSLDVNKDGRVDQTEIAKWLIDKACVVDRRTSEEQAQGIVQDLDENKVSIAYVGVCRGGV